MVEDASASFETAQQREDAFGVYERDSSAADENGTIWLGVMAGQIGIIREMLTTLPSARNWALEFANDITLVAAYVKGVADDEDLANLKEPITEKLVSSVVSSAILGQGFGLVEQRAAAFFEDALFKCCELTVEDASNLGEECLADYAAEC